MKHINKYIQEKLKISKNTLTKNTLFPKTKEELQNMIKKEVKEIGYHCSLNHIDVSKITDMSSLFDDSELYYFKGDISGWDVSNVKDMKLMFFDCDFNGDLSDWDVSNVENMAGMFSNSKFKNKSIRDWDVSNVKSMSVMFNMSDFNQDISNWKINHECKTMDMFTNSQMKDRYKPFKNGKRVD
jgi:hypothetical protein